MKKIIFLGIKSIFERMAKAVFKFARSRKEYAVNGLALLLAFNIASAAVLPTDLTIDRAQGTSIESAIAETALVDATIGGSIKKKMNVTITAYSSTPDQTDDTPFITASGAHVADGIIAANFLRMNTLVKIPKLFGNKVFVVKDRMHPRFNDRVDIWFADRASALKFGLRHSEIVVL